MLKKINTRLLYTILSALFIIGGTYVAIQYAKGSFRFTDNGFVPKTGLLNANSFPTGAEVLINGKLITATDDTIYLEPGNYQVEIQKDGFSSWQKNLQIQEELVTQTNALLFPSAPSLTPLTFSGVTNITPSPDGLKVAYYTASASTKTKNGLYVLELTNSLLPTQRGPRQITDDDAAYDLANAQLVWSPDSTEIMLVSDNHQILIPVDRKVVLAEQPDIQWKEKQIFSEWEEEMYLRERQYLSRFPQEILKIATESAKNVYISPDKKRIVYTATQEATIPDTIVPPVPATNTQPESRQLEPGSIYVYDREEDKNFKIGTESGEIQFNKQLLSTDLYQLQPQVREATESAFTSLQASTSAQTARNFNVYHTSLFINTLQWFPDSRHLIFATDDKIQVMEYDGTNVTTLYAGPFSANFLYPWPDGSKLILLTSFSPNSPQNLYGIELR